MTPSTHSLPLPRNLHVLLRRAAAGLAALRRWRPSRIIRRTRYAASLDELGTHLLRDINVPGGAYGHMAIEVDDAYKACDAVKAQGGKVVREAGPMKHGTLVIAFIEDPDGYKIEFIQKGSIEYPR